MDGHDSVFYIEVHLFGAVFASSGFLARGAWQHADDVHVQVTMLVGTGMKRGSPSYLKSPSSWPQIWAFWHVHHNHHHLSFNREGHWGITDDFTNNVLHCPLGLDELQACPFPDVVFPSLPAHEGKLKLQMNQAVRTVCDTSIDALI